MNDNGKVFLALLAGVAAGAAVALLVAPEKGSELRKRLADSTKDLTDSLLEKAEATFGNFVSGLTDKLVSETEQNETEVPQENQRTQTIHHN